MFKRLFWLSVGVGLGFGTSFFLTRMVKRQVQRYSPLRISSGVNEAVRELRSDLVEAVREGREAMKLSDEMMQTEFAEPRGILR